MTQHGADQDTHALRSKLSAAMDRQEATSEILAVVSSSPRDPQPVFNAIVRAGSRLFPGATISIAMRQDDEVHVAAISGPDPKDVEAWRDRFPAPLHPETIHGHVILKGKSIDLADVANAIDRFGRGVSNFLASGYRAVTMMPVSRGDDTVGALAVLRLETGALDAEQFAMLQTFVSQANIAIENTHLVNEMRAANSTLENVSHQLAKYIPPQLYSAIISGSQKVAIESRRKKLTIFFSDIVDFVEITDQLEAEELTLLLNEYLSEMSRIARRHGAYFDKFIGDAMMFYFGEPDSKGVKADASSCVEMAADMQHRLAELEHDWRQRGLIDRPFQARIGINTGYCTVGNFGSDERMDYTIVGGEVNLAARLEAECPPGGIMLGAETYSLVKDQVRAVEQEPLHVKGFRNPIRPYAVTEVVDDPKISQRGFHAEGEGFSVTVDPSQMDASQRQQLARRLSDIASDLNGET